MRLNSSDDIYVAFDVVTEIKEYVEQQLDKGISYEDRFHNVLEYLNKEQIVLQQEIVEDIL